MWQEITVKDGRVAEGNFDEYQIARIADYPRQVNIAFLKTNNKWISGIGEEAIPQNRAGNCASCLQDHGQADSFTTAWK